MGSSSMELVRCRRSIPLPDDEEELDDLEFHKMSKEIEEVRQELEDKAARHQDELKKMKDKLQKTEKKLETVEKWMEVEKDKVRNLEETILKQKQELDEYREKEEEQKCQLKEQENQLERQKTQLEKLENELEITKKNHKLKMEAGQKTISEHQVKIKNYSKLILEQTTLIKEAKTKLEEQDSHLDKVMKEKSDLESKAKEQCVEFENLQVQLERQVKKCSEYRAKLEKSEEAVEAKERRLEEATEIIIEQQKKVEESDEQKKQLKKIIRSNLKLDKTVLNLNSGINQRQAEIERLEGLLRHEREENTNAQVKFRSLREQVFKLKSELSMVIGGIRSSTGVRASCQADVEDGNSDDISVQGALESLAAHVRNKFDAWSENQKMLQQELAKMKKVASALSQVLESRPVSHQPPAEAVPSTSTELVVLPSTSDHSQIFGGSQIISYRDITRRITFSEITNEVTADVFSSRSTFLLPVESSDWPALTSENHEELDIQNQESSQHPTSTIKHGIDASKRHLGWYCTCGEENFESVENLRTHVKNILSKHPFKCFMCPERFRCMRFLKSHLWRRHNVVINPVKRRCVECGRMFSRWKKLYEHKKTVHTVQRSRKFIQRNHRGRRTNQSKGPSGKTSLKFSFKRANSPNSTAPRWRVFSFISDSEAEAPTSQNSNLEHTENDDEGATQVAPPIPTTLQQSVSVKVENTDTSVTTHAIAPPSSGTTPVIAVSSSETTPAVPLPSHLTIIASAPPSIPSSLTIPKIAPPSPPLTTPESSLPSPLLTTPEISPPSPPLTTPERSLPSPPQSTIKNLPTPPPPLTESASSYPQQPSVNEVNTEEQTRATGPDPLATLLSNDIPPIIVTPVTSPSKPSSHVVSGSKSQSEMHNIQNQNRSLVQSEDESHGVDLSKIDEGYFCICGRKSSSKDNLKWHIQYFTQEWKFKCEKCDQKFYCLVYLKRHYALAHKMSNALKDFSVGCSDCGIMFRQRKEYLKHRRDIHNHIPWKRIKESQPTTLPAPEENVNPTTSNASQMISLANIKMDPDAPSTDISVPKHGVDRSKAKRNGFYCLCGHKAKSKYTLSAHINYKSAEEKFFCSSCNRGFVGTAYLRRHMLSAHGIDFRLKGCRKCGAYFSTNKKLRKHMTVQHKVKRVKIVHVDLTNYTDVEEDQDESQPQKGEVKHAKDTSKGANPYFCLCGAKFSTHHSLTLHAQNYNENKNFQCNICDRRFLFNSYLHNHLKRVHKITNVRSEGLYGCRSCGRLFKNLGTLSQHRKTAHGPRGNREHVPSRTQTSHSTQHHHLEHHVDKQSTTEMTPPTPSSPMSLATAPNVSLTPPPPLLSPPHGVKQEPQEEKSECINDGHPPAGHQIDWSKNRSGFYCTCGQNFPSKEALRRHVEYHATPRQFKCNMCPANFKSTGRLKQHVLTVHKINYEMKGCRFCGKLFQNSNELRDHQYSQHQQRRHKRKVDEVDLTLTDDDDEEAPSGRSLRSGKTSTGESSSRNAKPLNAQNLPYSASSKKRHGVDLSKRNVGYFCICGVKTSSALNLNTHINYFTAAWKFHCQMCDHRFLQLSKLKEHLMSSHNISNTNEIDKMGLGCVECGQVGFSTNEELSQHHDTVHASSANNDLSAASTPEPSPPKLYPETTLPTGTATAIAMATSASVQSIVPTLVSNEHGMPPPPLSQDGKHGIDLSKNGYSCTCGQQFAGLNILKLHIIKHIQQSKTTAYQLNNSESIQRASVIVPPKQRPSTATSENHKAIRVGRLSNMFVCLCGDQFKSEVSLQRHIHSRMVPLNQPEHSYPQTLNEPDSSTSGFVRTSKISQQVALQDRPSIIIQTGPSRPPDRPATLSQTSETSPPTQQASDPNSSHVSTVQHEAATNSLQDGLFHCICGRSFHNKSGLTVHIQWFTSEKKFSCNLCTMRFIGIGYLKKHLEKEHKKDMRQVVLIGCRECGETFSCRGEFTRHRIQKHGQHHGKPSAEVAARISTSNITTASEVPCSTTSSISIRLGSMHGATQPGSSMSSVSTQQDPPRFFSDEDDDMIVDAHLTFEAYQPQVEHGIDHFMAMRGYFCLCGTEATTKYNLNKHIRYYSASYKFVCKTCGHGFLAPGLLRNHMLKVHKIIYNVSSGCRECGQTFSTNMELSYHYRMVHNNGFLREMKYTPSTPLHDTNEDINETPPISDKAFPNINNASNASSVQSDEPEGHGILLADPHTEENSSAKNFSCKCGNNYLSRTALMHHIRVLAAGKIFKCHLCDLRFYTHANLKNHIIKIHKVKYDRGRYACGLCATPFATQDAMKIHRRTVHDLHY